jgi:flagellar basal-body rod protein FlgB
MNKQAPCHPAGQTGHHPVQRCRKWRSGGKFLPPAAAAVAESRGLAAIYETGRTFVRARPPLSRLAHLLLLLTRGVIRMFENVFGIHEQALLLQGQRIGILATNLANADTPNYKARDIDFSAVLSHSDSTPLSLSTTQASHIPMNDGATASADLMYRNPYQASLDGNTVEMPVEQAAFSENNVRYQASLGFINGTIASMLLAINGQ